MGKSVFCKPAIGTDQHDKLPAYELPGGPALHLSGQGGKQQREHVGMVERIECILRSTQSNANANANANADADADADSGPDSRGFDSPEQFDSIRNQQC